MTNTNSQQLKQIHNYISADKLDSAAKACTTALRVQPDSADLWSVLSQISLRTGQAKVAVNAALKAIDLAPDNVRHVFHLTGCYLHLQIFSAAQKALKHAKSLMTECNDPALWDKLGELFYMANDIDTAIEAHRLALMVAPNSVSTRNQLGALLRFVGNIEEAETLYLEALERQPSNFHACYNLSQLRRYRHPENLLTLITKCQVQLPKGDPGHIMLHYALGKLHEDSNHFSTAFEQFSAGAQLKRQQRPYKVEKDIALMQAITAFFTQNAHSETLETHGSSQKPIFIVGLPRTGTTLVERIIASHSTVVSGDELNAFPMALLEAGGRNIAAGIDALDNTLIEQLSPQQLRKIGQRYLELANNYVNNAPIFVDKLPYNFLYCGFILNALPQAKIIHVKRNPLDAAVSNYKMLFDRGYEYSYDQEDLAEFIVAYEQLMSQWKTLYPDQIHTVQYEHLVNNQVEETKALLDFCSLPWQQACLDFHKNKSATHTASASQVREPIHSRSINLWRQYEQYLQPLLNAFEKHGITPINTEESQW